MTRPARIGQDERDREVSPPARNGQESGLAPGGDPDAELQRLIGNQRMQRRLAGAGGEADGARALGAPAGLAALLLPDWSAPGAEGGLRKSEFLELLEAEVTRGAEAELRGTGRTVDGCPWIAYWFRYYQRRDAEHLARAVERYAPEANAARSAAEVVDLVTARVRSGIRRSLAAGQLVDLPPGIPPAAFEPGSPVPAGEPATDPFGLTPEPLAAAGEHAEQAAANAAAGLAAAGPAGRAGHDQLGLGEGRPLEGASRSRLEGAFRTDLSDVRLHTDAAGQTAAGRTGARAFAYGSDIALAPGNHAPGTPFGDALLAHEVAHVLQQRPAARAQPRTGSIGSPGGPNLAPVRTATTTPNEPHLEADADLAAAGAVRSLWPGRGGGAAAAGTAQPALASPLRISRCGGEADAPSVQKTVPVKPIKFFESTGDPDADVAFGNTTVFNQANVHLDKQAEETFDETRTEEILGPDHTLDTSRTGRTGEESALISALGSESIIPIVYVKEVEAPPGGTDRTGEQIENVSSCGGVTVVAVENGIHSQTVSHELGHALGLGHKEGDENNLMHPSAGGHKTQLDPDQVTTIRSSRYAH